MASSARSYIRSLPTTARVLSSVLVLGAVAVGLPALAAHWPTQGWVAKVVLAKMRQTARVPSPADIALLEQTTIDQLPPHDRMVTVHNVNTGEDATFNIGPGGYVRSDQTTALDHFFRCRRTDRANPIDPGVLLLLADVAEHWPGHTVEIISGFRAPPFGVPHSRHFIGHAIDLRVRGVRTTDVRDYVWREHQGIGVGYYAEGDFVHVDSRSSDQEVAWSGRKESSALDYNPRWAKQARPGG